MRFQHAHPERPVNVDMRACMCERDPGLVRNLSPKQNTAGANMADLSVSI